MISRTRVPPVGPPRPVSQPGMTWPAPISVVNGEPDVQEDWKTALVRQIAPTYWTAMSSLFLTTAPVPLTSVLTCSLVGAATLLLILTVGPVVLPGLVVPTV